MKKHLPLVALAGIALTMTGCGTTTATPAPTVTVTETTTETVTETETVTPKACLDYIDATEKALESAAEVIRAQKDGLDVSRDVITNNGQPGAGDIARLQDATERMKAENATLSDLAPKVREAKVGCQDGGTNG